MKFAKILAKKNDDIFGAEPATVAFLGDSVTHGCFECYIDETGHIQTVFERENAYAAKFAQIASRLYPRAQLNIINGGTSGGTAVNAVERLDRDILRFCPDLVVVNFALNDCGAGPDGLTVYRDSLARIFARVKETGAEVILLTPNLMCDYVSAHIREDALQAVAESLMKNVQAGYLDMYVETAVKLAQSMNVPVCDCYALWRNMRKNGVDTTALLSNYLNHPAREMQWLFAVKLAEMIFGAEEQPHK